jgi:hypothetical protein
VVWTQGITLVRQVAHFRPFLFWLLWRQGLTFFPGSPRPGSSCLSFLPSLGWKVCHHAQLFSTEMGVSQTFHPRWPGMHSLRWQMHPTTPSYWLRWHLTFLTGLTAFLLISASQVARITDVSCRCVRACVCVRVCVCVTSVLNCGVALAR